MKNRSKVVEKYKHIAANITIRINLKMKRLAYGQIYH